MLGIVLNTRSMSVRIEVKYQLKVLKLLNEVWHPGRKTFNICQAQKMTDKLARLVEGAYWVYHLMSHMYTSVAFALSQSKDLLLNSSSEYKQLLLNIQTWSFKTAHARDQDKHVRVAMKQAARQIHHSKQVCFINKTMRDELEFFRAMLHPDSGVRWEMPFAFKIKKMPVAVAAGDSCLDGGGGYSIKLSFWWYLAFP